MDRIPFSPRRIFDTCKKRIELAPYHDTFPDTYPVSGAHPYDDINRLFRKVPAVPADDERTALQFLLLSVEYALDEVFRVVLFHEHFDLLSEAARAWFLALERGGLDHDRLESHHRAWKWHG